MGVDHKYVVCGLLAVAGVVLAWVATWMDVITFKNEMFVMRDASDVYELIADLRNHNKFHPFLQETELLHTETSSDGIEKRMFRLRDQIPLPLGFQLPLTFDALIKLTKPNEELVCEFDVGGTKGKSQWTLRPHKGAEDQLGTLVTEEYTMQCMWITCGFVLQQARSSHQQLFLNLKNALDHGIVP